MTIYVIVGHLFGKTDLENFQATYYAPKDSLIQLDSGILEGQS